MIWTHMFLQDFPQVGPLREGTGINITMAFSAALGFLGPNSIVPVVGFHGSKLILVSWRNPHDGRMASLIDYI